MCKIQKIFVIILAVALCLSLIPFVSAESTPTITVSSKTAVPKNNITLTVNIDSNPGIAAYNFCVVYDTDILSYTGYTKGFLKDYNVINHSDKGYITFVNCESKNYKNNGTIISLKFKVRDNAPAGTHKVGIENINRDIYGTNMQGCFVNFDGVQIIPTIKAGAVTIGETCDNTPHKYGEWNVDSDATCTSTGSKSRSCSRCGHTETEDIPKALHDYEDEWTIDKVASPEEDGVMSRHCKNCDNVTDVITFEYEDVTTPPDDNDTSDDSTSSNDTSSDSTTSGSTSSDSTSSSTPSSSGTSSVGGIVNTEGAKHDKETLKENIDDFEQQLEDSKNQDVSQNDDQSSIDTDADVNDDTTATGQSTDNKDDAESESNGSIKLKTVIIGGCAIIVLAAALIIVLLAKRKKKENK